MLSETVVSTLAGGANGAFSDSSGTNARFNSPCGVAVDSSGDVFVADYYNHRIRKVTADGGTRIGPSLCIVRACCVDVDVEVRA